MILTRRSPFARARNALLRWIPSRTYKPFELYSLTPDTGPELTEVIASGRGFTEVVDVKYGIVSIPFSIISDNEIAFDVPLGAGITGNDVSFHRVDGSLLLSFTPTF